MLKGLMSKFTEANPISSASAQLSDIAASVMGEDKGKEEQRAEQRWRLEQGRTHARVQELIERLGAAQKDAGNAETIEELNLAHVHTQQLEDELTIARKKDATARAQLHEAKVRVAQAQKQAKISYLVQTLGPQCADALDVVGQCSKNLRAWRDGYRQIGLTNEEESIAGDVLAQYYFFIRQKIAPITGRPPDLMGQKYESWTESLPDISSGRPNARI